jgi:hypothetical protein
MAAPHVGLQNLHAANATSNDYWQWRALTILKKQPKKKLLQTENVKRHAELRHQRNQLRLTSVAALTVNQKAISSGVRSRLLIRWPPDSAELLPRKQRDEKLRPNLKLGVTAP